MDHIANSSSTLVVLSVEYSEFKVKIRQKKSFVFGGEELDFPVSNKFMRNHIGFYSSGTTSKKLYFISKAGFLLACETSCVRYGISKKDVYGVWFPKNYIAKALVFGRVLLSGCKLFVSPHKWSPRTFYDFLRNCSISILSLVPTQLYDLVNSELNPPPSLRLVFVSGGPIDNNLLERAKNLGWPVVVTFGSTETCGMIAEKLRTNYRLFANVEVKSKERKLFFKGEQVAKAKIEDGKFQELEDWVTSGDLGYKINNYDFKLVGRFDSKTKIKGHLVDLHLLQAELKSIDPRISLVPINDQRAGTVLKILTDNKQTELKIAQFLKDHYLEVASCIDVKAVDFLK
ncbi:MAG: AMP-binding protein [Deltaproteobacteria bacterium]|nr:AMP-binding protein [Deltaproteobacteria bacterium]